VATWFSSDSDDLYGEDVSDLYTIGNFPAPPPPFVRGDCNPSGAIDLADGLSLLNYLFVLGSPTPPCLAACDVNGDDGADLGDALYLLNFLFVDGAAPPDPYPDCGTLPMMVACDSFAGCP